jgi:amino-acid N-acetyltransferase
MSLSKLIEVSPIECFDALIELLRTEGLPHSDLREPGQAFWQLSQNGQFIGYAGAEGFTSDRLLRSFVLSPPHRSKGYGSAALAAIELPLAAQGVRTLHLLTTTAAPFSLRHGFVSHPRASAPDTIKQSLEFSELCPSTAAYLAKTLS